MQKNRAEVSGKCPHCANDWRISQVWTVGGINDRGGWIVECASCSEKFDLHVGKDVMDSLLLEGGKVVASYDDEIDGDRQSTHDKYGV